MKVTRMNVCMSFKQYSFNTISIVVFVCDCDPTRHLQNVNLAVSVQMASWIMAKVPVWKRINVHVSMRGIYMSPDHWSQSNATTGMALLFFFLMTVYYCMMRTFFFILHCSKHTSFICIVPAKVEPGSAQRIYVRKHAQFMGAVTSIHLMRKDMDFKGTVLMLLSR